MDGIKIWIFFCETYLIIVFRMDSFETRWREVVDQIEATGLVDFTEDELIFGSRTAWRNAPRCSGRSSWNSLVMRDCR